MSLGIVTALRPSIKTQPGANILIEIESDSRMTLGTQYVGQSGDLWRHGIVMRDRFVNRGVMTCQKGCSRSASIGSR